MFRRPGLPVSFLVGIFSAIALGVAWGLVYLSMPMTTPSVTVSASAPEPLPPPILLNSDTPVPVPLAPSTTVPVPSDSPPSLLSHQNSLPAFPPADERVEPPSRPVPKTPKALLSRRQNAATEAPSASPPPSLPLPVDEVPALQGVSPACIVELEKLCEGTQPGGARRKCFKENENKLSPICQRQMDEMASRIKEDMQHFRTACAGDVKQFCPDVRPGGGNVLQCLEDNYKEVSENCYQALKRFQARKAGRSL